MTYFSSKAGVGLLSLGFDPWTQKDSSTSK